MPGLTDGIVPVAGTLGPTNTTLDTHPVTDPFYGIGGYRVVADLTERDAIPNSRRREGMVVHSISDDFSYRLVGGIGNGNWVQFSDAVVIPPRRYALQWSKRRINNNDWVVPPLTTHAESGVALPFATTIKYVTLTYQSVTTSNNQEVLLYIGPGTPTPTTLFTVTPTGSPAVHTLSLSQNVAADTVIRFRGGTLGGRIQHPVITAIIEEQ